MSEEPIFHPLTWWLWLGMGLFHLGVTIGIGTLFGGDPINILLLRDESWDYAVMGDYAAIAVGIWLAFRQMQSDD